jgi:hypothetical protein
VAVNLQPAAVISAVVTIVGALAFYQPNQHIGIGDQTGYAPQQPIEFSHKEHAKDHSIPCEFCHSGARKGAVAGIPAAGTCLKCHVEIEKESPEVQKLLTAVRDGRPIEWVRVHDQPDFVRFDHSAHVSKGVACQTCHGPVETMARIEQSRDMNMGWCVTCHRDYTAHPPKGMKDVKASVECSACHF